MNLGTDAYFDRMQGRIDDEAAAYESILERHTDTLENGFGLLMVGERDTYGEASRVLLDVMERDGFSTSCVQRVSEAILKRDKHFTYNCCSYDLSHVIDNEAERMAEQSMGADGDDE